MNKIFIIAGFALLFCGMVLLVNAQQNGKTFSHKQHVEEQEMACKDCHTTADTSLKATDNLLPVAESCYTCHEAEGEFQTWVTAQEKTLFASKTPLHIAFFPHAKHLKANEPNCSACHAGVEKSANMNEVYLPQMASCTQCHNNLEAANYCQTCHAKGENLKPVDHQMVSWKLQHGVDSQINLVNCAACHTTNACIECHQGDNLDHKVHGLNYQFRHGIFAKGNKTTCITCHEEASFCNDCHRTQMVMPRSHARANWTNKSNGGGHARAAKLDLDSCIACHSENKAQPICIQCHK
jgi:hypothetical protein